MIAITTSSSISVKPRFDAMRMGVPRSDDERNPSIGMKGPARGPGAAITSSSSPPTGPFHEVFHGLVRLLDGRGDLALARLRLFGVAVAARRGGREQAGDREGLEGSPWHSPKMKAHSVGLRRIVVGRERVASRRRGSGRAGREDPGPGTAPPPARGDIGRGREGPRGRSRGRPVGVVRLSTTSPGRSARLARGPSGARSKACRSRLYITRPCRRGKDVAGFGS